jgi:hypothetical protein
MFSGVAMNGRQELQVTLLPGARTLLDSHAREIPQRDDLCGAFCGALALHAAGLVERSGEPLDQDAVALAAGSVVAGPRDPGTLPRGENGRRDYRLALPSIDDPAVSGTTAEGVVRALGLLSDGHVHAIPYSGPWTSATLAGLFEAAGGLANPVTLLANLATRHLWGSRASLAQLLAFLLDGEQAGPPPEWDVGHFACVFARVRGPGGTLYALADTYPSLGSSGVHLQPEERLAAAIARPDMPAGGVIAVTLAEDTPALRAAACALGLMEGLWDNGTPSADTESSRASREAAR